jgi:predicted amidohydrolase YtcJ
MNDETKSCTKKGCTKTATKAEMTVKCESTDCSLNKSRGSIEAGKLADLVVIDRDYLTCPEDQIKEIAPVAVILDGKLVSGKL